ncbi:MAG: hypothetical protein IPM27_01915 [Nitrosomonadales bacterium]|nr:hypothetical protein [Nitrosomonadales bacterium]
MDDIPANPDPWSGMRVNVYRQGEFHLRNNLSLFFAAFVLFVLFVVPGFSLVYF